MKPVNSKLGGRILILSARIAITIEKELFGIDQAPLTLSFPADSQNNQNTTPIF
jgi:hypothetical protein